MKHNFDKLAGVSTALVTPFDREGRLDVASLESHIQFQRAADVAGLVPVGTTGEAPTLSESERDTVIEKTVELAAGEAFVLAGTGANDTAKAVAWTRRAEQLGVDGCLVVTPYYNKPTQQGLIDYFSKVADSTSLPIILYSVPGRCGVEVAADTAARLAERYENIVGIKEAGGDVDRVTRIRHACGNDFIILSGDDGLTLPFLAAGARGVISVVSNLAPDLMVDLQRAWDEGRIADAQRLHLRVFELAGAMFIESSPVPVKTALALERRMNGMVRSPLVPLSQAGLDYLKKVLSSAAAA